MTSIDKFSSNMQAPSLADYLTSAKENDALADSATTSITQSYSGASKVAVSAEGLALLASDKNSANVPNGYAMMLRRLFNTTDPSAEPAVATRANMSSSDISFLNQADRQVLGKAYQYAMDNKIDLAKVDALAGDLGGYRFLQATGNNIETKQGTLWNTDGSPWYSKMTTEDTATATRILQSDEVNQTSLDSGFIAYVLNPRGGGWSNSANRGHSVDFNFLEQVIGATTPTGRKPETSSPTMVAVENSAVTKIPSNPLFQNSLHWISHQDVPNLPPDGYVPPSVSNASGSDESGISGLSLVKSSLLNNDYINNLLDVVQARAQIHPRQSPRSNQNTLLTAPVSKLDYSSLLREILQEKIKAAQ